MNALIVAQADPYTVAADILDAFSHTGRPLDSDRALSLAQELRAYGGLENAIAALEQDDAFAVLGDALACRAALAERRDPDLLAARLLREARDLDARAESAWVEAAEFHDKAASRLTRGENALAGEFHARALAAERMAAEMETEALQKRLRAAELQAGQGLAGPLRGLLAA